MDKEVQFILEDEHLYLTQSLVEYMDIPIFFLCKSEKTYYVVLCTDIENLNYVIVATTSMEVYSLLHGITPMRDIILQQNSYWEVVTGNDVSTDVVTRYPISLLDSGVLPERGACFKVLTKAMAKFVDSFDNEYFNINEYSNITAHNLPLDEVLLDVSCDDSQYNSFLYRATFYAKKMMVNLSQPESIPYEDFSTGETFKLGFHYTDISEYECANETYNFAA